LRIFSVLSLERNKQEPPEVAVTHLHHDSHQTLPASPAVHAPLGRARHLQPGPTKLSLLKFTIALSHADHELPMHFQWYMCTRHLHRCKGQPDS
jgi:hypothetical protein